MGRFPFFPFLIEDAQSIGVELLALILFIVVKHSNQISKRNCCMRNDDFLLICLVLVYCLVHLKNLQKGQGMIVLLAIFILFLSNPNTVISQIKLKLASLWGL